MYNHATKNYACPLCIAAEGREGPETMVVQTDIIYKDELVTALVNSFFRPHNMGHVIVIPNKHFENIYDMDDTYLAQIAKVAKKVAIALKKAYKCDGTSIAQHNEPAGNQDAFHYHLHVFPRYVGDDLYGGLAGKERLRPTPEERMKYADKLKKYL